MPSQTEWVASLSPWPKEFGLGRIRALLEALGNPHRSYDSIHVVGSNGKSTATRTIAELSRSAGRRAGAYTSPHVSGWAERIWVDGDEADFERAIARVRRPAEEVAATQFEALTAAAFAEFAAAGVEVAAVEAGLGGRLDATNVVDAPVVLLTNVTREHADVLGETPQEIAREKLAVAHAARVVVLPDNSFVDLVPQGEIRHGGARVRHIDELAQVVQSRNVSIGVVATPPQAAQDAAGRLVRAGVTSILNFAPVVLSVPRGVAVRKVDLAVELQILSYYEQRRAAAASGAGPTVSTGSRRGASA